MAVGGSSTSTLGSCSATHQVCAVGFWEELGWFLGGGWGLCALCCLVVLCTTAHVSSDFQPSHSITHLSLFVQQTNNKHPQAVAGCALFLCTPTPHVSCAAATSLHHPSLTLSPKHTNAPQLTTTGGGWVRFEAAPMKLTRELLEVMDSDSEGQPSELFDYFKVRSEGVGCVV